jgi:acrylyl-CoA reductase (NADPH)
MTLPSSFRALRVSTEGAHRARIETVTLDALTPGNVVIRVVWSGINYKDALAITGKGRILKGSPRTPGIDLAGYVVASEDARFRAGDAVLVTGCDIGEKLDGGYSEYARLPAAAIVPLPAGLSLREAMSLGTAGFTAAFALRRMLDNHQTPDLGPIAVTGPTGGVGSLALALLKQAGFKTAAITAKPQAEDFLRAMGADEIIHRESLPPGSKPLEAAIWGGAVDNLGGETLAGLIRTVKTWGNIVSIGLAQGHELHTTVMPFILRGVSLLGIHSVECPRDWRLDLWAKLQGPWKPHAALKTVVTRTVTLEELPAACEDNIAGKTIGRTLVRVGDDG